MIRQQLAIALLQEAGQGILTELLPVVAQPVVVEHVHQDAAKAAPGGLEAGDRRPVLGVGIGEGVYLAVQPDPLIEGGFEPRGQRPLDEVSQQVASEGASGVGRQVKVRQVIHGIRVVCRSMTRCSEPSGSTFC
ncbi:hypothetical protein D3C84_272610 [compost metagenome]